MKKILLTTLTILLFVSVKAQYKDYSDYLSGLKKQGKLTGKERIYNPNATSLQITKPLNQAAKNGSHNNTMGVTSTQCNCWIPRDASFQPVPFDGSGANGPPVAGDPNFANDDWSTNGITLPFNFCLYGDTVGVDSTNLLYINNNGNISFGTPNAVFTAVPFPSNQYNMIAPFWGDVDTRDYSSKFVYYQLTSTHLIIQWDSVAHFQVNTGAPGTGPEEDSLVNTFQLIITDGTDPILPAGYNISFCYGDMQWTTGDASSGVLGFGGFPATVGINKGDSSNYFQLSLFDTTGTAYTNPTGTPASGVDWLDYRSFLFNSCGTTNNLPPLSISNDSTICDTLTVYLVGDTLLIQRLASIPPEANQFTTLTASSPDLGSNFSVINSNSGVVASLTFRVSSNGLTLGNYYHITATSTDNGTPALSTTMNYVVYVADSSHNATTGIKTIADKQIMVYPNPNNGSFVVETNNTKQFMQVFDITGKVVLSKTLNDKTTVDAGNLNEGVYYISLTSNKGVITKKLVIVR